MDADAVVMEITRRAWRLGAAVYLSRENFVPGDDGHRLSGYFVDEDQPILAVATGCGPRWLGILLHEYCHLTQWAEGAPVWKATENSDWAGWVNGKKVKNIRAKIAADRELEADCERRTIRLIRELDAPLDIEEYARGANAYIHFYNVMADRRKWYMPHKRPYNMPAVLAAANPTLDRDFSKTPKALYEALLECTVP